MSKTNKVTALVLSNVALVLFSIAGALTGTLAWFGSQQEVETTASSFAIYAGDGITYDLYYLRSFTDAESASKDGNYNTRIAKYAGYEKAYEDATFAKVEFDEEGNPLDQEDNPLSIEQLWPAHRLTYALLITSATAPSKLTLESFTQTFDASAKVSESQSVSLTWAIDMFGAAYNVTSTGDDAADVATGFESYYATRGSIDDAFPYSQELDPGTATVEDPHDIITGASSPTGGTTAIFYFTIEFSNAPETFYTHNDLTGYFVQDDLGNSNCYENLRLGALKFTLA